LGNRKLKEEASSIFKMAIGIIIMDLDFIYGFAAMQFENQELKHDMVSSCLFISSPLESFVFRQ
jgi:hypothetical protein